MRDRLLYRDAAINTYYDFFTEETEGKSFQLDVDIMVRRLVHEKYLDRVAVLRKNPKASAYFIRGSINTWIIQHGTKFVYNLCRDPVHDPEFPNRRPEQPVSSAYIQNVTKMLFDKVEFYIDKFGDNWKAVGSTISSGLSLITLGVMSMIGEVVKTTASLFMSAVKEWWIFARPRLESEIGRHLHRLIREKERFIRKETAGKYVQIWDEHNQRIRILNRSEQLENPRESFYNHFFMFKLKEKGKDHIACIPSHVGEVLHKYIVVGDVVFERFGDLRSIVKMTIDTATEVDEGYVIQFGHTYVKKYMLTVARGNTSSGLLKVMINENKTYVLEKGESTPALIRGEHPEQPDKKEEATPTTTRMQAFLTNKLPESIVDHFFVFNRMNWKTNSDDDLKDSSWITFELDDEHYLTILNREGSEEWVRKDESDVRKDEGTAPVRGLRKRLQSAIAPVNKKEGALSHVERPNIQMSTQI